MKKTVVLTGHRAFSFSVEVEGATERELFEEALKKLDDTPHELLDWNDEIEYDGGFIQTEQ